MEKVYFDTTVLVAACIQGHPQHTGSAGLLGAAGREFEGYLSGHGLAELYSVLTRAPFTPPVYPAEAWRMIEQNVLARCRLVVLEAGELSEMIRNCAEQGWVGGQVYDLIHFCCARKAACDRLYTLNQRHFRELAPAEWSSRILLP
jgi:predicted nucleic acid-binding protein